MKAKHYKEMMDHLIASAYFMNVSSMAEADGELRLSPKQKKIIIRMCQFIIRYCESAIETTIEDCPEEKKFRVSIRLKDKN